MNEHRFDATRLLGFRQALESVVEDLSGSPSDTLTGTGFSVQLDVFEHAEMVEVLFEVPGVSADDLELTVSGGRLVLEGHRPAPPPRRAVIHCLERSVGRFRRGVDLPEPVDTRRALAELRDGVLSVRIPRIADRRGAPHRIDIGVREVAVAARDADTRPVDTRPVDMRPVKEPS